MDGIIKDIYESMVRRHGGKGRIGKRAEEEILRLLERMERLGGQEREECRESLYFIAYEAEEDGFEKGFQCASRLFAECMRDRFGDS